MKKHIILPITLAAMMLLGGCGKSSTPASSNTGSDTTDTNTGSDVVVNSVSITNKDALTAEWYAGEATRKIAIAADPEIEDLNDLLDSGALTITSSDSTIVSVARLMLSPVAAGTATVTVAYGGKSDSVDITISAVRTAKDKYGTVHAGTADDPFDNADAIKASPLAIDASDTTKYYIKGTVESFYHKPGTRTDGYVSWYFNPTGSEAKFEAYKILKEDGTALTDDDIWVGAEVVIYGALTVYNDQYETDTGTWVENTGNGAEKPAAIQTIEATVAEALTVINALEDKATTDDKYAVTGYITAVTTAYSASYGNISFTIGETPDSTDVLTCYRVTTTETDAAKMVYGQKIKVTGFLQKYVNSSNVMTPELLNGAYEFLTDPETPATGITLPETAEVAEGETVSLKLGWEPFYATKVDVTWSSADETIATVADGVVTGVKPGSVVITATAGELTANCTVTVTDSTNYGTLENPLTIAEAKAILDKAGNKVITASPMYVKGIVESSTYSSSYKNYTVWLQSDDGTNAKEFELYAAVVDSSVSGDYTATDALRGKEVVCYGYGELYGTTYEQTKTTVGSDTVYPTIMSVSDATAVDPTSVTVSAATASIEVGATYTLTSRVYPGNNNATGVTWSSDNTDVATVSDGVITGVAAGTATITATAGSVTATCAVTVTSPSEGETKLTIDLASLETQTKPSAAEAGSVTADGVEYGTYGAYMNGYNGSNYLMFNAKGYKTAACFYNKTAINGAISKVVCTTSTGVSVSAKYYVTFGTAALSSADVSGTANTVANKGDSFTVTNSATDSNYFNISVDTTANGQLVKVEVYYTAA